MWNQELMLTLPEQQPDEGPLACAAFVMAASPLRPDTQIARGTFNLSQVFSTGAEE